LFCVEANDLADCVRAHLCPVDSGNPSLDLLRVDGRGNVHLGVDTRSGDV
jgi:hypothetical protein